MFTYPGTIHGSRAEVLHKVEPIVIVKTVVEWEDRIHMNDSACGPRAIQENQPERIKELQSHYSYLLRLVKRSEAGFPDLWTWHLFIGGWEFAHGKAHEPKNESSHELNTLCVEVLNKIVKRRKKDLRAKDLGKFLERGITWLETDLSTGPMPSQAATK